jgi:hypothetical protein
MRRRPRDEREVREREEEGGGMVGQLS